MIRSAALGKTVDKDCSANVLTDADWLAYAESPIP
jgi:hypothetical protein